ncbi:cyd operon protein YbgE [Enterobacter cancerogenus]|uniref:cyd operon protein YbgE n=1 Tax=Enterobacter cancerogenus TaxID=69218 RepID=UPI000536BFA1|nr:cyd operon protein YbgE [Enterobacter cancerogenus]KGT88020.1 cytochrome bd biosynthesis protein [Enterobacter cancerogenus]
MRTLIQTLYRLMDKGPLRALSLILALWLAGCVIWQPSRFAARTSDLAIWHGLLMIWAVCTGVIHGTGFRPLQTRWRAVFSPLPAMVVLILGIYWFYH